MTKQQLKAINLAVKIDGTSWKFAYKTVMNVDLPEAVEFMLMGMNSFKLNECDLLTSTWLRRALIIGNQTEKLHIVVGFINPMVTGAYCDFLGRFVTRNQTIYFGLKGSDLIYPRLANALYDSVPKELRPFEFPIRQRFANSCNKKDLLKKGQERELWAMIAFANKTHDWMDVADYLVHNYNEDFVLKNLDLQEFLYGFIRNDKLHIGVSCTYPMRTLECDYG